MRNLLISFMFIGLFTACASSSKKATKQEEMKKAKADSEVQMSAEKVECTMKKDMRIIEVVADDKNNCHVDYTKFGKKNNVAQSTKGHDHCKKVQGRIKANLEKAGFVCK